MKIETIKKVLFPLVLVILMPIVSVKLLAEDEKVESKTEKTQGTEHNFEDLLVQGKYHFSDSAVTTVEEDKVLDSLLGVRSEFKDRIENSEGRW